MILYNITFIIDDTVNSEWLEWMNEKLLPAVANTDLFISQRLLKVLDSPNAGETYCLQVTTNNIGNYHMFKQAHEPGIIRPLLESFENKLVFFNTLMEFID
ncbi:DUF4286 family protein [Arcticibacter tournemirensis]|nr:DUF4286 family protein [Arcticibacter tournemirensis]